VADLTKKSHAHKGCLIKDLPKSCDHKGFLLEDLPSHVIMLSLLVLSIDRQLQIRTNNKVSQIIFLYKYFLTGSSFSDFSSFYIHCLNIGLIVLVKSIVENRKCHPFTSH
jgi:hypothetical protein